jgi:hypothetical protein
MNPWTLLAVSGCLLHAASLVLLVGRIGGNFPTANRADDVDWAGRPVAGILVYGDAAEGEWDCQG